MYQFWRKWGFWPKNTNKSFVDHFWSLYRKNIYRVQIKIGQKTIEVKGLYDTGNSLYEPIRRYPVSIIQQGLADELMEDNDWTVRLCMIPYRSIGVRCGLMRGFVADELIVFHGRYLFSCKKPVLAIANESFGDKAEYQIILHSDLI